MRAHRFLRRVLGWVGFWAISLAVVTSVLPLATAEGPADAASVSLPAAESRAPAATSLQITSLTITPSLIVQGSSFNATVVVSGGQRPYSYSWTTLPSPCNPGNVSSWLCTPNNPGQYTINVQVTDVGHNTTQAGKPLSVVSTLQVGGISVGPNPVSQNSQFQVSVTVSGGAAPYTFDWTSVPPGCSAGNHSSWPCTESQTGTFPISVLVHDTSGQQGNRQSSINVTQSGNGGSGNGNGNGSNHNGNSSNGLNLSGLGSFFVYALIAGIVSFALLVALTVGVIMIAVILARRLPRPPKKGLVCSACGATAAAGSKFCPSCGSPLTPAK